MTPASSVRAFRVLVLPILQWKNILLEGGFVEHFVERLELRTEMWEGEVTLSEEYFHSSTLSTLFLFVNLGLAPMEV